MGAGRGCRHGCFEGAAVKHIQVCLVAAVVCLCLGQAALAAENRVFDLAGLLRPDSVAELEARAREFRERFGLDMVLLTTSNAGDKTSQAYADDFYDDNDFGVGKDKSGLLLLIDMDNRKVYVSTCGEAIRIFTDSRIDTILNAQYPRLKARDYNGAFRVGLDVAFEVAASAPSAAKLLWVHLAGALAGGAVVAGLVVMWVYSRYKKDFIPVGVTERLDCDLTVTRSEDRAAGTTVTSRVIPEDKGGGGFGGSSTHTSSSGRTHGGGGRSF